MANKLDDNFKLIKNGQLDVDFFKSIFSDIKWLRAPRKLNNEVSDFWHIGKCSLDDGAIEVTIKVSPDKCMRVVENQVRAYKTTGGKRDWGAYVEVVVGDSLFNKIVETAEELPSQAAKKVDW